MEASRCLVGNLGSEVGRGASGRQLRAQPCSVGTGQVGRVCEQPVGTKTSTPGLERCQPRRGARPTLQVRALP